MNKDITKCAATVLLPTTAGRAKLLPYSVGSIQKQTISDIEIFIMGDGVDEQTRQTIHTLMKDDERIRFFDNPKHERRGEPYRHEALKEATGKIVCYMCDRDLLLMDHVELMYEALQDADFAYSMNLKKIARGFSYRLPVDYVNPENRPNSPSIPLSTAAHTLAFYRTLPHGWRTTPTEWTTDNYMWRQCFDQPVCRVEYISQPTAIYLHRRRKQKSVDAWQRDMAKFTEHFIKPGGAADYRERATTELYVKTRAYEKLENAFDFLFGFTGLRFAVSKRIRDYFRRQI